MSADPGRVTARPRTAREVAGLVVERVLRDGAFAAAALDAKLSTLRDLSPQDRAFATELTYGSLRFRRALEARVTRYASKGIKDPLVLAHLMVAAYQLLISRDPAVFAAVDGAVEAIKHARGTRVSGFANAVLRRLVSQRESLDAAQALRESVPEWLLAKMTDAVGETEALALLGVGFCPKVSVRLLQDRPVPDWLAAMPEHPKVPGCRLLESVGDPRQKPGFAEGAFVVQEPGSQLIALAVGARAGERVLDACAGRGQKSTILAERVGKGGELWATDTYPAKLRALQSEFERLKLPAPETRALDWTMGYSDVPENYFDRVLVDAPCTGVGTLRRRPEIVLRLTPEDPERLASLAEILLRRAATRAKPGGRVIFSVCSILRSENECVTERVRDILEPAPFDAPELEVIAPGATCFRLLPEQHGTDGYFVASFVRRTLDAS